MNNEIIKQLAGTCITKNGHIENVIVKNNLSETLINIGNNTGNKHTHRHIISWVMNNKTKVNDKVYIWAMTMVLGDNHE